MTTEKLNELRNELSIKSKNGIDFTLAASLIWLLIAFLWTLEFRAYDRSIFVFIASGLLLPMAVRNFRFQRDIFILSRLLIIEGEIIDKLFYSD
jgi:hypothetical protein